MLRNNLSRVSFAAKLLCGVACALPTAMSASAAHAQQASSASDEIVVTGTNIRGAAPVGQNIVQLDRKLIESTAAVSVQQLLTVAAPQLNGFGSAGQTGGSFEPRLRSLGGSSSASTLVLVDGHRITPGGGIANTADPNIVPAGAVERVEILPDGASALYGSDAVAGVINIITRKNYRGYEIGSQYGFGDSYNTKTANAVLGQAWDSGSVLLTYGYSYASNLYAADRDRVSGNQSNSGPGATNQGGTNFNTFACFPATVVPATGQPGATQVFSSPYATGTGVANNTLLNGTCSTVRNQDILPENTAHRLFISVKQELTDRLKVSANFLYSNQKSVNLDSRGTASNVTVFGTGATIAAPNVAGQINPFFTGPPGVSRETVSVSFDDLLGPGAKTTTRNDAIIATVSADYDLGHDWAASGWFTAGNPNQSATSEGAVCAACVLLALNGTTASGGDPTTNAQGNGNGTSTVVTRLPLTVANALDVWRAGTANRTSADVLRQIVDSNTYANSRRPITDTVLKLDGPLFKLPAGVVRAALGGEYYTISNKTGSLSASPIGPASTSSRANVSGSSRNVKSAFLEFFVPVVGEDMGVPLMQKLDLDISGRIDKYNDLSSANATTKNPKIGVDWTVYDDLKLRASYGTSFTAPTVGATQLFLAGSTIVDYWTTGNSTFTIPVNYPGAASIGCTSTATCTFSGNRNSGTNQTVNGIQVFGGNANLQPQTGRTWSAGLDFRPKFLDGFHANLTAWKASYRGVITNFSNMTQAAATPGLGNVLVINPTAQQIADFTYGRTASTVLPATIQFVSNIVQSNYINLEGNGLDFDVGHHLETGIGNFDIGVTGEYKYDWSKQTASAPWVNASNVVNTTNTIAPIKLVARANLGYRTGGLRADVFMNYQSDYFLTDANTQFAASPCPSNVTTNGLGCQHVPSFTTFDAHMSYDFPGEGLTSGLQVFADVRNIADDISPWVNSTGTVAGNGALNTYGNILGRVTSVGLRKKF